MRRTIRIQLQPSIQAAKVLAQKIEQPLGRLMLFASMGGNIV